MARMYSETTSYRYLFQFSKLQKKQFSWLKLSDLRHFSAIPKFSKWTFHVKILIWYQNCNFSNFASCETSQFFASFISIKIINHMNIE